LGGFILRGKLERALVEPRSVGEGHTLRGDVAGGFIGRRRAFAIVGGPPMISKFHDALGGLRKRLELPRDALVQRPCFIPDQL